jgi:hypothetical protein
MMITKKYRLVPEKGTAYGIQEGCCYEMVVYEGGEIGITERMDHGNEFIGTLLCCVCDPKLESIEISKSQYDAIREDVTKRRAN